MANIAYTKFIYEFLIGQSSVTNPLNLLHGDFKVALMKDEYTPNKDDLLFTNISDKEVDGNGYVAGGISLSNINIAQNENSTVSVTADSPSWSNSSITARYAVVYETTTGVLVACYDFGSQKSSLNGSFTLDWSSEGFLQFAGE